MHPKPSKAWIIADRRDLTIMEETGTGRLNVYYDRSDAMAALPGVKAGADKTVARHLIVVEIYLSR